MTSVGSDNRRVSVEEICLVLCVHLVMVLAMTWPAVWYANSDLFGAARGDKYHYIWVFWWLKHALLELGQLPFYTHLQYHPTGASMALNDMSYPMSLLSIPLQSFLEPPVILNLFLLTCLPVNGVAFYLLAVEVTQNRRGALAGSLVFAYCPYLLGRFQVSHPSLLAVFFIPLFLMSLHRYQRDPRVRHLAWAGVWLALQGLTHFYYGIALVFILGVFAGRHLVASRQQWGDAAFWRRVGLHWGTLTLLAGALLAPVVTPILLEMQRGDFRDAPTRSSPESLALGSADLVSYAVPDFTIAAWRGWNLFGGREEVRKRFPLHGNPFEKAVFPGWVSWIALGIALAAKSLRRRYWPWLAMALGCVVLSLGPTLYVGGQAYGPPLLPARLLHHVPVLNVITTPTRFAVFVTLGTGILVAGAIGALQARRGARAATAVALVCMAVTSVEFLPQRMRHFPRDVWLSPFYQEIRPETGDYAILNVPVDFTTNRAGADIFVYAQTVHHKPIIGGALSREPRYVFETLERSSFLQALLDRVDEEDPRLRLSDHALADLAPTLEALRIRYVVVHRQLLSGAEWERVNAWLERGLGPSSYEDRWIRVYRSRHLERGVGY